VNKNEVIGIIEEDLPLLKNRFGVIKIGLFGSAIRGDATPASDIDIAVELDENHKTMNNFLELKRRLEALFQRKVDLGIESAIKPLARKFIEKEIVYVK